jgi:hypothetical protein
LKTYLRQSNEWQIDIFKRKSARANYPHNRLFCIRKEHGIFDIRREKKRTEEKEKEGIHKHTHTQTAEI